MQTAMKALSIVFALSLSSPLLISPATAKTTPTPTDTAPSAAPVTDTETETETDTGLETETETETASAVVQQKRQDYKSPPSPELLALQNSGSTTIRSIGRSTLSLQPTVRTPPKDRKREMAF